jgi:hypothetical protein
MSLIGIYNNYLERPIIRGLIVFIRQHFFSKRK